MEPAKISKRKWAEASFECSMDLTPADAMFFATEEDPLLTDDHLSYMASDAKRNTEVSIKWLPKSDRRKFEEAQSK